MFDFNIIFIIPLILILSFLLIYLRKKKNKSFAYLINFVIFYIYMMFVAKYTLFPIIIGVPNYAVNSIFDNIELIPFNFETPYFFRWVGFIQYIII